MRPPVGRHSSGRAWHRLGGRTVLRWRQGGPVVKLVGLEAPEPVLTRLEASDDRVPGRGGVGARVLGRRRVAAADVPALGAPPQVEPPPAGRLALNAPRAARRNRRVDPRYGCHWSPF